MSIFSREYSRREFMKLTAKGLAGVTLTSPALALLGCTAAQAAAGQVELMPGSNFVLAVNRAKCTGCQRCEYNCTLTNDGKAHPFISRIHTRDYVQFGKKVDADFYENHGLFGDWSIHPETCRQCDNAPCVNACPVKAITPDPYTGVRMLDQDTCVGCGACVKACPFGMAKMDPEINKSTKCILCGACVAGCPTNALRIFMYEDFVEAMKLDEYTRE